MLGEVIRRYGLTFERRHITALSRQLLDEAEHYDTVARIVERLGGRVPVRRRPRRSSGALPVGQPRPPPPRRDRRLEHERDGRHRARSRRSSRPGRRYDLPDVVRGYEQIIKDEKFHVGLGRLLLDRYAENEADRAEVMRAMRGMAAITVESHVAIDPG